MIFVLSLAALMAGSMWLMGLRGPLLMLAAAALAFGSTFYLLQGRPGLPGAPREGQKAAAPLPLDKARAAFLEQFTRSAAWLTMADGLERNGNTQDAVNLLQAQVKRNPGDFVLWLGLGNALTDHGKGLTPAADLAFRRAMALAPDHPAPRYFRGLAMVRSGQTEEGVTLWREILATAPADASWRPLVEQGVAAFATTPADDQKRL